MLLEASYNEPSLDMFNLSTAQIEILTPADVPEILGCRQESFTLTWGTVAGNTT